MPSFHPEQDGFDGVWLAELEMLLFVVFDQLGEKLEPGRPRRSADPDRALPAGPPPQDSGGTAVSS